MSTQELPGLNEKWQHSKTRGIYTIDNFIWNAEGDNLVLMVVYSNDRGTRFTRSLSNFLEPVRENHNVPRFVKHGS